jgi:nucleoside-diphosphate-sugar epimerase
VLITGASGFAGRHLLAHLAGAHGVEAWFRSSPPPSQLRDAARWRPVDLLDRASVRAVVALSSLHVEFTRRASFDAKDVELEAALPRLHDGGEDELAAIGRPCQ